MAGEVSERRPLRDAAHDDQSRREVAEVGSSVQAGSSLGHVLYVPEIGDIDSLTAGLAYASGGFYQVPAKRMAASFVP
jgi:hypothetical protein